MPISVQARAQTSPHETQTGALSRLVSNVSINECLQDADCGTGTTVSSRDTVGRRTELRKSTQEPPLIRAQPRIGEGARRSCRDPGENFSIHAPSWVQQALTRGLCAYLHTEQTRCPHLSSPEAGNARGDSDYQRQGGRQQTASQWSVGEPQEAHRKLTTLTVLSGLGHSVREQTACPSSCPKAVTVQLLSLYSCRHSRLMILSPDGFLCPPPILQED